MFRSRFDQIVDMQHRLRGWPAFLLTPAVDERDRPILLGDLNDLSCDKPSRRSMLQTVELCLDAAPCQGWL
jgi:hypothetical protein